MNGMMDLVKKNLGLDEEDAYEEYVDEPVSPMDPPIVPDHSFYEIILIKAEDLDDVNYAVDQLVLEKNPVVLDLTYLADNYPDEFAATTHRLKELRENIGIGVILIAEEGRNTLLISPQEIKLVAKG